LYAQARCTRGQLHRGTIAAAARDTEGAESGGCDPRHWRFGPVPEGVRAAFGLNDHDIAADPFRRSNGFDDTNVWRAQK